MRLPLSKNAPVELVATMLADRCDGMRRHLGARRMTSISKNRIASLQKSCEIPIGSPARSQKNQCWHPRIGDDHAHT
jgi:hypothetical protein